MKLLAIECSSSPVSAAIISNGEIISYSFSNIKLTHSQTLFPIIEGVLSSAKLSFDDIDAVSVATGPGSFTGLRIGIASAKGIAEPKNLKCVGVSTLLSAAYMFLGQNAVICPVIDARCSQVYNALFEVEGDRITRICDDRAILIDDLVPELNSIGDKKIILCCDAVNAVFKACDKSDNIILPPPTLMHQNATGVGLCAYNEIILGNYTDCAEINPVYLKLPQAERELRAKQERK